MNWFRFPLMWALTFRELRKMRRCGEYRGTMKQLVVSSLRLAIAYSR
jgi:hypothetical protein